METKIRIEKDKITGRIEAIDVELAAIVKKYERNWVARVPQLKTFGYSTKSQQEAFEDLNDALNVFFEIHRKLGTLEEALIDLGWKVVPKSQIIIGDTDISLPFFNTTYGYFLNKT